MSTTLSRIDLGSDPWVSFPASWGTYLRLHRERGDRSHPRLTFVDGRLTIVSPGTPHEFYKTRLGMLIEDMLAELMIDCIPTGSTTLLKTRKPKRTGTEPDESYYLTNLDRINVKEDLVMGRDPAPDLVVEVVVSHPEGDALEAYRRIGVREVWVCRDTGLEFLVLNEQGVYESSPTSAVLPFVAADELTTWLFRNDLPSASRLKREFRAWVQETLAPRLRPPDAHA